MATASSPKLRIEFEKGSGEGVTAERTASLLPWAARAMAAPSRALAICALGESCDAAAKASRAATGTRTKVCRAFHRRSKEGIMSATNYTDNKSVEALMVPSLVSTCCEGVTEDTQWR